jgi:predicted RNA-binding Zn-ribbon protein involved in translation (DUF1610 family)
MSQAYQVVFECPKGGHPINLQRKCARASLTVEEAIELFGNEELRCQSPKCGWRGKVAKTKLLRILPFNWILSPAT